MKSKLGIVFALMCVMSFFLYRMGETNKAKQSVTEELIRGVVIDASTQEPIANVSIGIAGTNPRSRSDENGEFLVLGTTDNDFMFRHPDYKSIVIPGKDIKLVKLQLRDKESNTTELK